MCRFAIVKSSYVCRRRDVQNKNPRLYASARGFYGPLNKVRFPWKKTFFPPHSFSLSLSLSGPFRLSRRRRSPTSARHLTRPRPSDRAPRDTGCPGPFSLRPTRSTVPYPTSDVHTTGHCRPGFRAQSGVSRMHETPKEIAKSNAENR